MAEPGGAAGSPVRWDQSAARTQAASVASVTAVADRVVLSFGVRHGEDAPGSLQGVELLRRIALQPMTAKHLHDMLARLLAEATATKPGPG